jgi:hypothetical protein
MSGAVPAVTPPAPNDADPSIDGSRIVQPTPRAFTADPAASKCVAGDEPAPPIVCYDGNTAAGRSNPPVIATRQKEPTKPVRRYEMLQPRPRRPVFIVVNPFRERFERLARFARETASSSSRTGRYLGAQVCWVAAIEAAELSRAISHSTAQYLRSLTDNPALGPYRLVESPDFPARRIYSDAELDTVESGCLLVFVLVAGYATTLSHVMVAVGNGEAVGSNNGALNHTLSARWQRVYVNDYLVWYSNGPRRGDGGRLEIYAVSLAGTEAPQCSIM